MKIIYESKTNKETSFQRTSVPKPLQTFLDTIEAETPVTIHNVTYQRRLIPERDEVLVNQIGGTILNTLQCMKTSHDSHHLFVPLVAEGWIRTLAEKIHDMTQEQR